MRPLVEVPPYIQWVTIGCAVLVVFSILFLWREYRRKNRNNALVMFWALMIVGSLALGIFGVWQWRYFATRKPTPAEAKAWIQEADVKLKQQQQKLLDAADKAHKVYEKYNSK